MEKIENIEKIKEIINSSKGYLYIRWYSRRGEEIEDYTSQVKELIVQSLNFLGVPLSNISKNLIITNFEVSENFSEIDLNEFKKKLLLGIGLKIKPTNLNDDNKKKLLQIIADSKNLSKKYFSLLFDCVHRDSGT